MFKNFFRRALGSRFGGLLIFSGLFLIVSMLTRVALLIKSADGVAWRASLLGAFATGFAFDLAMASFFSVLPTLALVLASKRLFTSPAFRASVHLAFVMTLAVWLFIGVSEWLFWDEFGVRFNFVAVDYLVYTTEVIRNIRESYNMPAIFGGLFITTVAVWAGICLTGLPRRWLFSEKAAEGRGRVFFGLVILSPVLAVGAAFYFVGMRDAKGEYGFRECMAAGMRHMGVVQPAFTNAFNGELAKNGPYSFVAAYWANELDYDTFYPTRELDSAFLRLRFLLKQPNNTFVSNDAHPRDITRVVRGSGAEKKLNVIQITIESLSAEFLGCYGDPHFAPMNLTPNLDLISHGSVWFSNFHASGTRTVRGMEALSLCVPPTPGQAILRRPRCEDLATVGAVFGNHGYDRSFIYGGNGLMDNMNYFFRNNGYRVLDQPAKLKADPATKIAFFNAWGASDEDLFDWAVADADKSFAAGKPFHQFVMTTSNHRPFTWPAGRIDPKLTSREGAVAYTDYAIGKLLKDASTKPWFKDTVFVFVADHCASVAGKRDLEVRKYEVPLFIYCPAHFEARRIDTLCSQIDYAPTLFGMMNWSYVSRFFGYDVLQPKGTADRVFISNYQKVGLIENDDLVVLKPVRLVSAYKCDLKSGDLKPGDADSVRENAIPWYQCASWLFKNGGMAAIPPEKEHELLNASR